MKYQQKSFTVPALTSEQWERIFGKRSSSYKDARDQDARNHPANKGEQKCPTRS
jgi:hypothetical protein